MSNTLSRVEDILDATINGTIYSAAPQSRVEEQLIELKEVIEAGGGGGASTLAGLSDVSISSPSYGHQLIWDGTKWVNIKLSTEETGVLIAGETSVTISNAAINAKSTIDIYTDVYGVSPTDVTVSDGSVTLTFEARQTNLDVKVRIS